MKVAKLILILIPLLLGCDSNCPEERIGDAARFVNLYGAEAVQLFKDIDIEIRGDYFLIDYRIDNTKLRLKDNPKIVRDSVFMRFDHTIRFINKGGMTYKEFCNSNELKDSYYSLNYIHNDTLSDPKTFAFKITSDLVKKLEKFGLQEVDSKSNCTEVQAFYLYPRCNENYHVVIYVPDTTLIFPSIWKNFIKTKYAKQIKDRWYYYTYQDFSTYSDFYHKSNLQPKVEENPCFNK